MPSLLVSDLLPVLASLPLELGVPAVLQVFELATVAFLFSGKLIAVPLVKSPKLISLLSEVSRDLLRIVLPLLEPGLLLAVSILSQVSVLVVASLDLFEGASFLLVELIQVDLLGVRCLPLLLLDVFHQLFDLGLETLLEFFLHLCVFFQLGCRRRDGDLELLASAFALPHEVLVLGHVLLQIVEDLQFFIEGDQRVEFVFQLDLLLFEQEL